jgi:SAM-dependent methyltransferase
MPASARDRFLELLRAAVADNTLAKLTLGKPRGADPTLENLLVRPVALKTGPHLAFVWRHATRDITKNHPPAEALALLEPLIGADFLDAHLFTATQTAQLECQPDGSSRVRVKQVAATASVPVASPTHDRVKSHLLPADAPWLSGLGVTNNRGQPRDGMADKFRQIQKFTELLSHLLVDAGLYTPSLVPGIPATVSAKAGGTLRVIDMGSGKGYLTFAVTALLGDRAQVQGIEARPGLVELCNRVARENNLTNLSFTAGQIDSHPVENRNSKFENPLDVLIALHACDTATDDALAKGIAAGATLLVVSPCCQKELRPQLSAPPVLADALRHGIFQERQAEFVTDALRAQLLEWAGYHTKVFEFVSTEHTAKNLMIAAIKGRPPGDPAAASRLRDFAAFYGIRHQRLAAHLGVSLTA